MVHVQLMQSADLISDSMHLHGLNLEWSTDGTGSKNVLLSDAGRQLNMLCLFVRKILKNIIRK